MATPEEPSRALVNFTSGITFSSSPLTNWMLASSSVETREEENAEFGANAAASGRDAMNAVYFMFIFLLYLVLVVKKVVLIDYEVCV